MLCLFHASEDPAIEAFHSRPSTVAPELPSDSFELWDLSAGYWVSRPLIIAGLIVLAVRWR
jgi:hypothetical protein